MTAAVQRVRQRHPDVPGQLALDGDGDEPQHPPCARPDESLCPACDGPDVRRTRTGWLCGTCAVSWRGPDDR